MPEHGPLPSTEFKVELDGAEVPGFLEVKLPKKETEEYDYREGDDAKHTRKMFGDVHYSPLVLARGADEENGAINDWLQAVEEGNADEARKDIAVVIMDQSGENAIRYEFSEAWVREYEPPTLNAQANGGAEALAIETFTVEFEEMERKNQ